MRNEKEVKKLVERYEKVKQERSDKIVDELCELIFSGVEKILDKDLSVYLIVLKKNVYTECIDIVFVLEEYESIVKSIENRELLYISTEVRYFETTLDECHNKLAELGFVEKNIYEGDYMEDEVSFEMHI